MNTMKFPSGRSVNRCRDDAKVLVKSSKTTENPVPLHIALDRIAAKNGIASPWYVAIRMLEQSNLKSIKNAQMHLLGHALNLVVSKGLINMDSTVDLNGEYLECRLINKPTIIVWKYIGYGEIKFNVWWNFDKTKHPQHLDGGYKNSIILEEIPKDKKGLYYGKKRGIIYSSNTIEKYDLSEPLANRNQYKKFVGVICGTWIERKNGKYLQTENGNRIVDSYVRVEDRLSLKQIPDCIPKGFDLSGEFFF